MIVTGIMLKRCFNVSADSLLEQTRQTQTDFLLQDRTLLVQECDFAVDT